MNGAQTLDGAIRRVVDARAHRPEGLVQRVVGLAVESIGPPAALGEECLLLSTEGKTLSRAQVVGFADNRVFTMPVERLHGLSPGARVIALGRQPAVPVGEELLGRIIDADGRPLDGRPLSHPALTRTLEAPAPAVMSRARIREPFVTGVRSIDAMLTLGRGQRIGIFAGSGVGKSTLLGMMARHARADVAVLALVGERGREVRDFIEEELGGEGLRNTVVVVATSDEPPMRRIRQSFHLDERGGQERDAADGLGHPGRHGAA